MTNHEASLLATPTSPHEHSLPDVGVKIVGESSEEDSEYISEPPVMPYTKDVFNEGFGAEQVTLAT